MAWAWQSRAHYIMALTDGYVEAPKQPERAARAREVGTERAMAEYVHQRQTGQFLKPDVRDRLASRGYIPARTNVWVIGADGWLPRAPPSFQTIGEGTQDPRYRVFITGYLLEIVDTPVFHDESLWLREAGMVRKHTHPDTRAFKAAAREVLDLMLTHRRRARAPPTSVLVDLGVPVQHVGS